MSAVQYAQDQPEGYVNHVKKVAIIGAGGQSGKFMTAELLKNKDIVLTALTRVGSKSKLPQGVQVASIDYEKPETIVAALRGQDLLIATLPNTEPEQLQRTIVDAAVQAGVKFFVPNEWGHDAPSEEYGNLNIIGAKKAAEREYIRTAGLPFIAIAGGFWYEFSLSGGIETLGIDANKRKAQFIDDGQARVSMSTWGQVGRAVAAVVALPILPQNANDQGPTLSKYVNSFVRIQSFALNQREILDAVQRETGTTDSDWEITSRPHAQVHKEGMDRLAKGDFFGSAIVVYSPNFFPQEYGNFVKRGVLDNEDLHLPQDDLAAATQRGVQMAKDDYLAKRVSGEI